MPLVLPVVWLSDQSVLYSMYYVPTRSKPASKFTEMYQTDFRSMPGRLTFSPKIRIFQTNKHPFFEVEMNGLVKKEKRICPFIS